MEDDIHLTIMDVSYEQSMEENVKLIEDFLKLQGTPCSEEQIADRVFGIKEEKDIPYSEEDLVKLTHIKDALKKLVQSKRVIEALLENPTMKNETLYYSIKGWYAT